MKSLQTLRPRFLGLLIILTCSPALGQEKIDISAGAGFPELVNLGLRFQLGQSQLGFYGGIIPGIDEEVFTVGADYYYHFGGTSNFSNRRPWYAKAGLNYLHDENDYVRNKTLFLVPRIGRDLNFSSRMGIAIEAGAFLQLSHSEVEIKPRESSCWFCGGGFVSIGPSFGLNVFYRL